MKIMNVILVHFSFQRRVGRDLLIPVCHVEILMRRRGSPSHRGLTAVSGCIVLGHQTSNRFAIQITFFLLGFCTACGVILWALWPHLDE
jgi:hypothetical protein